MAMTLRLTTGSFKVEWCDICRVSHAFADVYAMTPTGPVAVGQFADHDDDEFDD